MNKNRLEAFSDGVFAIAITLLILNIRLPEVKYEDLGGALKELIPTVLAYVMSFAVIGLYWIGHHQSFQLVEKTNRAFLWLNTLLLLCISFMPFPTWLLGRYPFKQIPMLIYGLNLVATNITGFIMLLYVWYHPKLASPAFTEKIFYKQLKTYAVVNFLYLCGILLSFVNPTISFCIYGFILGVLIFLYGDWSAM